MLNGLKWSATHCSYVRDMTTLGKYSYSVSTTNKWEQANALVCSSKTKQTNKQKMASEIKQCFNRWNLQSQPHGTDKVAHAFRSLCMPWQHPLISPWSKTLRFSSGKEGRMSKLCICLFCWSSLVSLVFGASLLLFSEEQHPHKWVKDSFT